MDEVLEKYETNDQPKPKHTCKIKKHVGSFFAVVFVVIFLAIIAVSVAYIADFVIYQGSGEDGLLWTVSQRMYGLFGLYK
ncbi:hypothetical protein [Mycoplasma simbae]|uniref:hypothetical protein n=1 Tax=Mycoplasma simbae TaxID=36744 RepID=UPI00056609DF|nr:hypothetical protein [Mycoplasma simbae]